MTGKRKMEFITLELTPEEVAVVKIALADSAHNNFKKGFTVSSEMDTETLNTIKEQEDRQREPAFTIGGFTRDELYNEVFQYVNSELPYKEGEDYSGVYIEEKAKEGFVNCVPALSTEKIIITEIEVKDKKIHFNFEILPRFDFSAALKILDEGNITMSENKEESGLAAMAGEQKVSSTGDQRTVNNVMRHEYKVLNDEEKAAMQKVKDDALAFHEFLASLGQSRELSLAKTKIEESVFWAVKHITG